ncbi:hypothetical protein R3P38DRAFT_2759976 [Favolaschia claudopus]|uniref:Uncharacterized protein n=1 Tax=Favolaschia claudopus TaxID=2862362 RepID=A0AAW0DY11_9AGAR
MHGKSWRFTGARDSIISAGSIRSARLIPGLAPPTTTLCPLSFGNRPKIGTIVYTLEPIAAFAAILCLQISRHLHLEIRKTVFISPFNHYPKLASPNDRTRRASQLPTQFARSATQNTTCDEMQSPRSTSAHASILSTYLKPATLPLSSPAKQPAPTEFTSTTPCCSCRLRNSHYRKVGHKEKRFCPAVLSPYLPHHANDTAVSLVFHSSTSIILPAPAPAAAAAAATTVPTPHTPSAPSAVLGLANPPP